MEDKKYLEFLIEKLNENNNFPAKLKRAIKNISQQFNLQK
jgi:uncharacterized protein YgfB (UPF0149 family)